MNLRRNVTRSAPRSLTLSLHNGVPSMAPAGTVGANTGIVIAPDVPSLTRPPRRTAQPTAL
eukprot:1242617-Pleurochrysis_carterae.AAC.1